MGAGVKKPRRRREEGSKTLPTSGLPRHRPPVKTVPRGSWMNVLARMAAESRTDGGAGLQLLLDHARFNERPLMSLSKRREAA